MSTTILIIGLMLFFSHFLSLQFRRTNIPDVLILMLVGIVIGPVLGITTPEDFGRIGSLIATIALVVILFEGGTTLNLDVLGKSLGTTGLLAMVSFVLTAAIIALIGFFTLGLSPLAAAILGVTLGNTSSPVVIPLVNSLRLSEKPATVLVLESALTDVLSIVGVFALLQIHTQGGVEPGRLAGSVMASLIFAAVIGVIGGIGWLLVLGKVRDFPNTISSTLAYVFIVYGLTEMLGFSGAIAALALGCFADQFQEIPCVPHPECRQEHRAVERNGSGILQRSCISAQDLFLRLSRHLNPFQRRAAGGYRNRHGVDGLCDASGAYAFRFPRSRVQFARCSLCLDDGPQRAGCRSAGCLAAGIRGCGRRSDSRCDLHGGAGQYHAHRLAGNDLSQSFRATCVCGDIGQAGTADDCRVLARFHFCLVTYQFEVVSVPKRQPNIANFQIRR